MRKRFLIFPLLLICLVISTTTSYSISPNTTVTFRFDGLQVIAFGDSNRVSDGILDVHHHSPLIEIKEIKAGKSTTIRTIKADELKGKVLNVDAPNSHLQPKRYYSPDMSKDTQDFRWCLDLESDLFQKQLYLKEDKLFTKIHFQVGEFFATELTDSKYQFTAGNKLHSFNRRIGEPAMRVQLQHGDSLLITGLDKSINLPCTTGVNYKVEVTNLPPKEMASLDHFAFYYDFFKEPVTRFMPVESKKVSYRPAPILCEAIVLGKSAIN